MNTSSSDMIQPQPEKALDGAHMRDSTRLAIAALLLAAVFKTTSAEAQTITHEQTIEIERFTREGSEFFRRGEYAAARNIFIQMEEIYSQAGVPDTAAPWNIALAEIRMAGFQIVTTSTPAATARTLNESNSARLETILGFSTLQQIQPVRENLQDALNRMRTVRIISQQGLDRLDSLPQPTNAEERRQRDNRRTSFNDNVSQASVIIPFLETTLQRINDRYAELQGTPRVVEPPVTPTQGNPNLTVVQPQHTTIPPTRGTTYHTERPWALGLGIGGAGLAAIGASAVVYLATNPQTVGEDRTITTTSNVLFWTGALAAITGAIIIGAGQHRVPNQNPTEDRGSRRTAFVPSIATQQGNVTFGISGNF